MDLRKKYPQLLLVDAGDLLTYPRDENKNNVVLSITKRINYDVINIGEQDALEDIQNLLKYQEFISSNISFLEHNNEIKPFKPYIIKQVNTLKVAIIGVTSQESFENIIYKNKNIKIKEPISTLNELIPNLKKDNNIIIVLAHGGPDFETKIAQKVSGITLIIGSHQYVNVSKEPTKIGTSMIVRTGIDGQLLGKINLQFSKDNVVIAYNNEIIDIDDKIIINPEIDKIIKDYQIKYLTTQNSVMNYWEYINRDIGMNKCKKCHDPQFKQWQNSGHYRAFFTLTNKEQSRNSECITCHSTDYNIDGKNIKLPGVQCTWCHPIPEMDNTEKIFTKNKHTSPPKITEKLCIKCHDKKSSPDFNFKKYMEKIKH